MGAGFTRQHRFQPGLPEPYHSKPQRKASRLPLFILKRKENVCPKGVSNVHE